MMERDKSRSYNQSVFDLMKNPHYWLSPEIGPKAFGKIFRELREREGYSQRDLAVYLGVDESTISMIEQGKRKPPLNNAFYQRLQTIDGWGENDFAFLMGTSAHRLLFPELEPKKRLVNIQNIVEVERIKLHLSLTTDRNIVSKDEHYVFMEMLEAQARLTLHDISAHRRSKENETK